MPQNPTNYERENSYVEKYEKVTYFRIFYLKVGGVPLATESFKVDFCDQHGRKFKTPNVPQNPTNYEREKNFVKNMKKWPIFEFLT